MHAKAFKQSIIHRKITTHSIIIIIIIIITITITKPSPRVPSGVAILLHPCAKRGIAATIPGSGELISGFLFLWIKESPPSIMVTRKPNWSFRDSKARDWLHKGKVLAPLVPCCKVLFPYPAWWNSCHFLMIQSLFFFLIPPTKPIHFPKFEICI